MDTVDWAAFLPAALVVALVPGANQLLGLRTAVLRGTGDAVVSLVGRFAAFALLVAVVAAGLGTVLARSAPAFEVVRWLGVAYLAWLGITTLRARPADAAPTVGGGRAWLVRREFLVAITNPKALLLFAAFLPQFGTTVGALVVLGGAYIGIEAATAVVIAVVGGRFRRLAAGPRTRRRLDLVAGTSFLGLAGALAVGRHA